MNEKILGLMFNNSHDNRERMRSINSQAYFINEFSKGDLEPDLLDHMKIISLDTERLSKELGQREKTLRKIFYECLDDVNFSGNQDKVIKVIEEHLQDMAEVKKTYDEMVEDTGIYQRLSDRIEESKCQGDKDHDNNS